MVPRAGLEPARSFLRGILSPLCLPISPPGRKDNYIVKDIKNNKNLQLIVFFINLQTSSKKYPDHAPSIKSGYSFLILLFLFIADLRTSVLLLLSASLNKACVSLGKHAPQSLSFHHGQEHSYG